MPYGRVAAYRRLVDRPQGRCHRSIAVPTLCQPNRWPLPPRGHVLPEAMRKGLFPFFHRVADFVLPMFVSLTRATAERGATAETPACALVERDVARVRA